jgi:uncharacterized repeat protein (TIGR01451 family)
LITFTPTSSAVGSVTNTASVTGGGDVSPANNSSSVTNTVNGVVDLTIDKSHTGNFTRGTNQTYSLVVTNAGSAATNANVTVTDVLPAGLSFVSGTGTGWNACTASAQTVTCVRPQANTIAAGTPAPAITLTVGVAANAAASITNTASVAGGGDANNTNNSDSDPTSTEAAGPTKLAFTTAAFSQTVNLCSPQITVQTQNASSAPTNPTANTTVNLTSNSAGGTFYSDAACSGGNLITSVPILATGNTASFYYKDSNVGTPTLTAAATGLTSATQQETITAVPNAAPTVKAGGPYTTAEGTELTLSPTVTDPDAGDVLTYAWTVNATGIDASGSCSINGANQKNAKITCNDDSNGGTFTLTLTVNDGNGHSVHDDADLTVTNENPKATFNTPAADVNEGSSFALSLTGASDASSNDFAAGLRYAFDCGSGYSATNYATASTTNNVTCNTAVDGPATLNVKGKVFDKDAGVNEYTGTVTVKNVAPTANAGGPYPGDEGSAIALDGSGDDVSAADKATLTFAWSVDFTGIDLGGSCKFHDPAHPLNAGTATSTLENPTIVCDDDSKAGTFTVTLHVSDDDGGTSSASNAALTVKNANPVADAGGPYEGDEGADIPLQGDATDVGANDTFTWKWVYTAGPGALDDGATCTFSDKYAQSPTINCTDDGTVTLTLTVKDDNLGESSDNATLTVKNVPPVANAGGVNHEYTGNEGAAIPLDASATDVGSNDTFTWGWVYTPESDVDPSASCKFYDPAHPAGSATSAVEDPTIKCTDNGTVKLTLTVHDDDGDQDSDVATLHVLNVAPTATFNAPSEVNEGTAIGLSLTSPVEPSSVDLAAGLHYAFDCGDGAGYGTALTYATSGTTSTRSCPTTDNGPARSVKGKIFDKDGGATEYTGSVTIKNVPPTATFNAPNSVNEGSAIALSLTSPFDPSSADVTAGFKYAFDCGDGSGYGTATTWLTAGTTSTKSCPTTDNGTRTVHGKIFDKDDGFTEYTKTVQVLNLPPTITSLTVSPTVVQIGGLVTLNAQFTDPGTGDTHTASIDWEGATSSGVVTEANGSGSVSATHTYNATGIYTVSLTVTDDDNGADTETFPQYIVVYDPSAGFVTGGGWINSPAGAYVADASLVGKANFGFVSKYITQKDKTTPVLTGNTEFQFQAGSLNFSSTVYDWMVVSGTTKASYKGSGTVNGAPGYAFLLSVVDGGSTGDRFRMKIWNKATSQIVYDNQTSAADDATASQLIAGGSIVIHTNGGLANK